MHRYHRVILIIVSSLIFGACTNGRITFPIASPTPAPTAAPQTGSTPQSPVPTPTPYPVTAIVTNHAFDGATLVVPGANNAHIQITEGVTAFTVNDVQGTIALGDQFAQRLASDGTRDAFGFVTVTLGNAAPKQYLILGHLTPTTIQHTSSAFIASNSDIAMISIDEIADRQGYNVIVTYTPAGSTDNTAAQFSKTYQVINHRIVGGESYSIEQSSPVPRPS